MKSKQIGLFSSAALFLFAGLSRVDGDEKEVGVAEADRLAIKKDIESVISAVFGADIETLEKFTHERVIAIVGDRETFRTQMKAVFGQFEEQGITLLSVEVGEEMDFFESEEHRFALVSTTIRMKVGDDVQPPAPGFQLGVKKKAEEGWKYIDCSALTTEMAREWFPDFPKEKTLPKPAGE